MQFESCPANHRQVIATSCLLLLMLPNHPQKCIYSKQVLDKVVQSCLVIPTYLRANSDLGFDL